MYIEVTLKDLKNIANESLHGGGKYSNLEIALAKKALKYHEGLAKTNTELSELFQILYSLYVTLDNKELIQKFKEKRNIEMSNLSKSYFKKALELNNGKDTAPNDD